MIIAPDHWVDTAVRRLIPGGNPMPTRRLLVMHFTGGASGDSSIEMWRRKQDGVLAHFVIERDGTLKQCRPLNLTCGHCGGVGMSRWQCPRTGVWYNGCNLFSIGIELANAGGDPGALSWARKQPGFRSQMARHANGGPILEWEAFPDAQLKTGFALAKEIVERYNLDDLVGHDNIAPERRNDPGPLFPMEDLRRLCGFEGRLVTHYKR